MHGIKVNELTIGARPIKELATSVIGLIATATAGAGPATTALNAAFPVGVPTLVTSVRAAILAAGTGGTLKPALEAIADQTSPVIIVVRVAVGADAAATEANAVAGADQLLLAESQFSVRPRILGAPGLDTQAVATALATTARKLRAMAYARCVATTVAEAALYRANFAARELMLIWPDIATKAADGLSQAPRHLEEWLPAGLFE